MRDFFKLYKSLELIRNKMSTTAPYLAPSLKVHRLKDIEALDAALKAVKIMIDEEVTDPFDIIQVSKSSVVENALRDAKTKEDAESYIDSGKMNEDIIQHLNSQGLEDTVREAIDAEFTRRNFFVIATPDLLNWTNEDREDWEDSLIKGENNTYCFKCDIEATSEDEALDEFHATNAIDCLDHWHIKVIDVEREGK